MGTRFLFICKFSILYCRRPNVLAARMPLVSSLREDGTDRHGAQTTLFDLAQK
jgi:hypothetical protein